MADHIAMPHQQQPGNGSHRPMGDGITVDKIEKAHEISRKIGLQRELRRDKDAPESNVSGGFNQKQHQL